MNWRRLKTFARFLPLIPLGIVLWREKPWTLSIWGNVPYAVLATIALNFGVLLPLKAARWRVALQDPPPFWHVLAVTIEGLLANAAIGLGSGDVVRAARLKRAEPQMAVDYASTWAERGAEFLALLLLVFAVGLTGSLGHFVWIGALAGIAGYVLALVLGKRIVPRLGRFPRLARALQAGLQASSKKSIAIMVLLSLAGWACEVVMLLFFAWAFQLPISFHTALLTLVGINAAIVIPATPGNFGTFEAGATLAMVLCGVARDTAVALALTYHLAHVVPVVLVATTVFLVRSRRSPAADPNR